jgi:predicted small secreted protein
MEKDMFMKKVILGIILGIAGTLVVQRIYKYDPEFRTLVKRVKSDLGTTTNATGNRIGFLDRVSLIWQRFRR